MRTLLVYATLAWLCVQAVPGAVVITWNKIGRAMKRTAQDTSQ